MPQLRFKCSAEFDFFVWLVLRRRPLWGAGFLASLLCSGLSTGTRFVFSPPPIGGRPGCYYNSTGTHRTGAGPVRFFSFQSWRCKKQFQAKKKLHFWKSSNDSKKLQVKNCQVKVDFSTKWPTFVSFLIVSTGSSQSKILARYLGHGLVCLSLAYTHNNEIF